MTRDIESQELVLLNGRVITEDRQSSIQQAVAIRGSHIQAVGSNDQVRGLAGPNTRVIDVRGRTVIPGIIDAHAHMDREGLKNIQPGLRGVRSISEILAIIEDQVARKRPGEWVVTMPIGDPPNYADVPATLAEKRYPTRWHLDAVSPDNPVYIRGIWSPWNAPPSISVANTRALQLAGIDRTTKSPHPSVVIERDAAGEPTGLIVDHNLFPVTEFTLMRVVPRFTRADRVSALRDSMRLYNSVGVTGIYEGHGVAPEVLQAYRAIWDEGSMTVRSHLVMSPKWRSLREAESEMARWGSCLSGYGFGDDMLRYCGYFIQLRGQRHVARLRSAELPFTGWAGFAPSYNTLPRFRDLVRMAARHNLRVHTIALSGHDLEDVVQAFEAVQEEFDIAGRRWVIEHVRDINPPQLARLRVLGVVCQTIPLTHIWLRGAPYVNQPDTANRVVPHQAFLQHGIPLAMGTDNKPFNPFHTLWAAVVRRERRSGAVIGPEQCLTRAQALRAFTMGGAYLCGQEELRGSLEPGKLADLAVLSDDPLQVPEERLPDIHAHLTIVGGRVVYDSGMLDT